MPVPQMSAHLGALHKSEIQLETLIAYARKGQTVGVLLRPQGSGVVSLARPEPSEKPGNERTLPWCDDRGTGSRVRKNWDGNEQQSYLGSPGVLSCSGG